MEVELKQWEERKEMRESVARKERERREKVLAEVSPFPILMDKSMLTVSLTKACKILR